MTIRTNQDDTVIDQELADALQLALKSIDPPKARSEAMRSRILARAREAKNRTGLEHFTLREDEGRWESIAPLAEVKTLFRSESAEMLLYRLQPGARLADHEHPTDEECVMLAGEMWIGDLKLRAGDFHLGRQGVPHREVHTETGALFYVRRGIVRESIPTS